MDAVIVWIKAHWYDVLAIYSIIVMLASYIVKLTPTKKDDEVLAKVLNFMGRFIAVNKTIEVPKSN